MTAPLKFVDKGAVVDMYATGATLRECAAHFGCSHERIRQILNLVGAPIRTWGATKAIEPKPGQHRGTE